MGVGGQGKLSGKKKKEKGKEKGREGAGEDEDEGEGEMNTTAYPASQQSPSPSRRRGRLLRRAAAVLLAGSLVASGAARTLRRNEAWVGLALFTTYDGSKPGSIDDIPYGPCNQSGTRE